MRMTSEEAKSCIHTIELLRRLAFNVHGVMDVVDAQNCDKIIEMLSKQSASSKQADKKLFGHGYWLEPGEVFVSHNVLNEVLNTIIKSMNTEQRKIDSILAKTSENDEAIRTDDQIAESDKMVDQFRGITKKTDDVPDTNVGKTDFKPRR